MSHPDDSGSGVEDSLRRPVSIDRNAPLAGPMFTRPPQMHTNNSTYAFAATPDSIPSSSTLPPQQVGWQPARVSPQIGYPSVRIPSFEGTPQAGPSTLFNVGPPRIERPQPAARGTHMGPPLPSFAASVGAGNNLFRPPAMPNLGSPSEASLSGSFSFAPRALFAPPTRPLEMPTLVRPVRPTTATAPPANMLFNPSETTPPAATNLDTAALAAERRIREARAASRTEERRRSVSFSPIVSTPHNGGATGTLYGAPPPIHRPVGAIAPSRPVSSTDASVSHLVRTTTLHHANASLSTDTPFTRPPATRLFPTTTSEAPSVSWTADDPSSTSHSANPPPPVRLRKWDGTATLVPSWLVSDAAESAVEEDLFDYDTIQRFDISSLLTGHALRTVGQGKPPQSSGEEEEEGGDVVKGILETQLGLRGLHGWYGHTYRNPRLPATPSRKRRHSSPPCSPHPVEEEPIVVYDSFGRIRGTITLPNYTQHGGPPLPLPSPAQTFALRHAAAHHLVLTSGTSLADKEGRLLNEERVLRERWRELAREGGTVRSERFWVEVKAKRKARETFQAGHRKGLLKGLQNALLDSTLVAPRRQVVAFDD